MLGQSNRVKEKIRTGKPVFGVVCRTLSPAMVELIGLAGFDFVWIDMEHSSADFGLVENLCRSADVTGMTSLVRVPDKNSSHVLRALEAGAGIVNVPQVESRAEVEEVVKAAKYFPIGERGYSSSSRGTVYGVGGSTEEVFAAANERTMTMVQIESSVAVENAEEICGVDGLDIVFIGMGDLSQSMGCVGRFDDPGLLEKVDTVLRVIQDSGKIAAIQTGSVKAAKQWIEQGVKLLCCAVDISVAMQGLSLIRTEFSSLDKKL